MDQQTDDLLVERETYLSAGAHIGTKSANKAMSDYIFRVKKNGLAVINLEQTDKQIRQISQELASHAPKQILTVGQRPRVEDAVQSFADNLGTDSITGRFVPGTLTNPDSQNFKEPEIIVLADPDESKQVIKEASNIGIPVVGLVDSGSSLHGIDHPVPCNNKAEKSVNTVMYLLAREISKHRDQEPEFGLNDFREPEEPEEPEETEEDEETEEEAEEAEEDTDQEE
jgi:Ribosomal protein S2